MSYLYGDSTPSPLEFNFIEFLRDALDFSVQVLQATERMQTNAKSAQKSRVAADAEIERLEKLGSVVSVAAEGVPSGAPEGATARCAAAIAKSAAELVRTETSNVRTALAGEQSKFEGASARERETCVRALEHLLLRHDLPDTQLVLSLTAQGGTRYVGRLRSTTPFGVIAMLDVEIPGAHLFGHVLRIDRVTERLEIMAPDAGGWLHKEMKMRPTRLEKLNVTDLTIGINESILKLRANPDGTGAGLDITIRAEAPRVRATRIGESQEVAGPPFELADADGAKLIALYDKLEQAAVELTKKRKALSQVSLDNHALRDHENPAVLVERLIGAMAPVVQEVAWRSRSATELVLKRLLADDRREEIFVAKAELVKKLDPLPSDLRRVFEPLGLAEESAPPIARASQQPLPRPATQPPVRKPATLPPRAEVKPPLPVAEPSIPSNAPTPVVLTSDKSHAAGGEIKIEDADDPSGEHRAVDDEVTVRRD
jgi:hypothetical protein